MGTGLSSAGLGLRGCQLCPGTAWSCSAQLRGRSVRLLLSEEREGSLRGCCSPFVGQTVCGMWCEEPARQSHRLGSAESAKPGKPQIVGCRDKGGRGGGFLLEKSAASLGRAAENIVLSFCFFSHF